MLGSLRGDAAHDCYAASPEQAIVKLGRGRFYRGCHFERHSWLAMHIRLQLSTSVCCRVRRKSEFLSDHS
jgi:hypothetical protein